MRWCAYGRSVAATSLPESGKATYGVVVLPHRECMLTTEMGAGGPQARVVTRGGAGGPHSNGGANACPGGPQVRRGFVVPSGARVGPGGYGNRVVYSDFGGPGGPQSLGAGGGTGASVEPEQGGGKVGHATTKCGCVSDGDHEKSDDTRWVPHRQKCDGRVLV
jgi:hypothetical protein